MKYVELTPRALSQLNNTVSQTEVSYNEPIIVELLDYLRWLADQDTSLRITIGHVWGLYHEGVREGRVWSEVCEDLGLPVRTDWSDVR